MATGDAFDMGIGGDQTQDVLWRLDRGEVDKLNPRLVVVLIGTNNLGIGHQTVEQVERGIDSVVVSLHRHLPKSKILLLALLPRSPLAIQAKIEQINDWLAQHTATLYFVSYVDLTSLFLLHGIPNRSLYQEASRGDSGPVLHPNALGAEVMARAMEPLIARALGDSSKLGR